MSLVRTSDQRAIIFFSFPFFSDYSDEVGGRVLAPGAGELSRYCLVAGGPLSHVCAEESLGFNPHLPSPEAPLLSAEMLSGEIDLHIVCVCVCVCVCVVKMR